MAFILHSCLPLILNNLGWSPLGEVLTLAEETAYVSLRFAYMYHFEPTESFIL